MSLGLALDVLEDDVVVIDAEDKDPAVESLSPL